MHIILLSSPFHGINVNVAVRREHTLYASNTRHCAPGSPSQNESCSHASRFRGHGPCASILSHAHAQAVDVWSVGCIFAELMLRRPFFPGEHYIDQLAIICRKLGKPKEEELGFVSTDKVLVDFIFMKGSTSSFTSSRFG